MRHDGSDQDEDGQEPADASEAEAVDAELVPAGAASEFELLSPSSDDSTPLAPLRLIDRFQLARLRSRKDLEAVEVVLDARIEQLKHATEAASQESKARWDARTAEIVSAMKTVVQARLRTIENERMASRFEAIESAYEMFAAKVREVETGPLPDELRADLVTKLRENLTATIERLESDAIADQYDLKD